MKDMRINWPKPPARPEDNPEYVRLSNLRFTRRCELLGLEERLYWIQRRQEKLSAELSALDGERKAIRSHAGALREEIRGLQDRMKEYYKL